MNQRKNQNKRLLISFSASLIGILFLIILANIIEPEVREIGNLTISDLNKEVSIIGEMVSISNYEGFQVAIIKDDTGIIKVISDSETPINKTKGELAIFGEVQEYEGEIEISADKIIELQK